MSKRPINGLIKDVVNENENDSDDEYNKCLRKVCRISYIENCQNAASSKTGALLCETSRFRFDCNASTSNVVQCGIKDVNDNAVQRVTSVGKVVHVSDQKENKVVNVTSRSRVHHITGPLHHRSMILFILGPDYAFTVLFLGTHTRTFQ
ncbi:hypothetical protein DVH24_022250 [Malus domestica]|uniref:Uncharacterized protein n=1 Tax=Malus domestica TaxID=3750 RepID=A0A498J1P6_MALDO|nr:hypothetical protein DVH24_034271 [Malus domestica]RXI10009.1 hypothetical protein DVH24_022250 [Malus domestica]